jgi:hypothetical protein
MRTLLQGLLGSWLAMLAVSVGLGAEGLKPFVLASVSQGDFATEVDATRSRLQQAGFTILGDFTPYRETFVDQAHVFVVTNEELKNVAQATRYGGFAAPWRVAVTQVGGVNQVSFASPEYIANAYQLKSDLVSVSVALRKALGYRDVFGSQKGLNAEQLRSYRYTIGMERFDDVYELAKYNSHEQAVEVIEQNLAKHVAGVSKVYRLDLANGVTVFGVACRAFAPNEQYMDDNFIMSNVDFKDSKGTAYLPYEIMVDGNQVVALHMRFRMALHYPDLKMVGANSFMKLMESPAAIEKALKQVAGN